MAAVCGDEVESAHGGGVGSAGPGRRRGWCAPLHWPGGLRGAHAAAGRLARRRGARSAARSGHCVRAGRAVRCRRLLTAAGLRGGSDARAAVGALHGVEPRLADGAPARSAVRRAGARIREPSDYVQPAAAVADGQHRALRPLMAGSVAWPHGLHPLPAPGATDCVRALLAGAVAKR